MQILRNRDYNISGLFSFNRIFILMLLAVVSYLPGYTQPSPATREATIKAVFLFNFSQFVEWPAQAFSSPASPFVIGILGDDPFGAYLDETIEGEKVNGRKIVIQRFRDLKDIKACHILFVSQKDIDYGNLFNSLTGKYILTVSDTRGFVRQGGMVRFSTENNRIKLEINADAAKQENLVISSKLLRIATIFDPLNKQ